MAEGMLEDEREEELSSIKAIYPDELVIDSNNSFNASITLPVAPNTPLSIIFLPPIDGAPPTTLPNSPSKNDTQETSNGFPKRDVHELSYLPPLHLQITLPEGYPSNKAPQFELSTSPPWLPETILQKLQDEGLLLWEEYGHEQVLFSYITQLQDAAERGFDLADSDGGILGVSQDMKIALLDFDIKMKREKFEHETFDCGICLEPKKGSACFRLPRCSHVFCVSCLQDFYVNCITEGDVNGVKCLSPGCGKENIKNSGQARKKKSERLLTPNELLQIPMEKAMVQRYVALKRKKKLESDKSTIYCPRTWCQGAARSNKYPKITDITQIVESDDEDEEDETTAEVGETPEDSKPKGTPHTDRLAICEDCNYAFCRVCHAGWHGEFVRCWPRDASELTQEEQASLNYILAHTSPCPTCSVPCQKTHGCNHMSCFQCKTHFCYLCSSWLNPNNPYEHFNQPEKPCYMRLWELEEGDDGNGEVHFDGIRGAEAAAQRAARAAAEAQMEEIEAAEREQAQAGANEPIAIILNGVEEIDLGVEEPVPPPAPEPPAAVHPAAAPPRVPRDGNLRRAQNMLLPARAAQVGGGRGIRNDLNVMGLQRFLQMVQDDEEDEWDSDELDDDDEDFDIPER